MANKTDPPRHFVPRWLSGFRGSIALATIVFTLIYIVWLTFRWGGEDNFYLIDNLLNLPTLLLAALVSWHVFRQREQEPGIRRGWLLIGLGFFSYFLGNLSWFVLESVLGLEPFPSIADFFYLLFYPLLFAGLFSLPGSTFRQNERLKFALDTLLILLTTGMLMWYFIIQPTAAEYMGELFTQFIAVGYPIGDLLLILAIIAALLRQRDRNTKAALWIFFLANIMHVAADVQFAYTGLLGEEISNLSSVAWMVGYAFYVLAALRQSYREPAPSQDAVGTKLLDRLAAILPGLIVIAGSITTAIILVNDYQAQIGLLAGTTLAILVLFIIRMYLSFEQFSFRNRLAGNFALLASLVLLVTLTSTFVSFRQESRAQYQQRLLGLASIIALQQDGDLHATIQPGDEETEAYKQIRAQNAALLATNPDIAYIYTMRRNPQGDIYFVVDTDETTDHPLEAELALIGQVYEEEIPEMMASFDADHPIVEDEFYSDEWGTFLSAFARFYRSDGTPEGIVGIDIRADDIIANERNFLLLNIGLFLLVLPLIVLAGWLLGNGLAAPIEKLANVTGNIATGHFSYESVESTIPEIRLLDQSLLSMTAQLGESVGNLEARVAERTRALQATTEVSYRLSTILHRDQLVSEVVHAIQSAFDYYHVHIYLYDADEQVLRMAGGTGEPAQIMLARKHAIRAGTGLVGQAGATNRPVLAPDVSQAENWLPNPLLPETRSEIAMPIAVGQRVLGVLDVQHNKRNGLTENDQDLLQSVANQTAVVLNNIQLYEQTQQRAEYEALVNRINQQIQRAVTVEDMLQVATQELGQALGATETAIYLQNKAGSRNGHNQS